MTAEQLFIINTRRSFYPEVFLGRLFENKVVFYLNQLQQNFFESLDISRYFFASHPRERVGVHEFAIFPFWLLPFFIWGLFELPHHKWLIWLYLLTILAATIWDPRRDTIILLTAIPVGITVILGVRRIWQRLF